MGQNGVVGWGEWKRVAIVFDDLVAGESYVSHAGQWVLKMRLGPLRSAAAAHLIGGLELHNAPALGTTCEDQHKTGQVRRASAASAAQQQAADKERTVHTAIYTISRPPTRLLRTRHNAGPK